MERLPNDRKFTMKDLKLVIDFLKIAQPNHSYSIKKDGIGNEYIAADFKYSGGGNRNPWLDSSDLKLICFDFIEKNCITNMYQEGNKTIISYELKLTGEDLLTAIMKTVVFTKSIDKNK